MRFINNSAISIGVEVPESLLSVLWGIYSRSGVVGSNGNSCVELFEEFPPHLFSLEISTNLCSKVKSWILKAKYLAVPGTE